MLIHSILRHYQDNEIKRIQPSGNCIDLGGGKGDYLFKDSIIHTTDINGERKPNYTFDLNQSFPMNSYMFDTVFCFNVLEHLHNPCGCIEETYRIMTPGGKAYFSFPFIFPYHASGPQRDYLRYTHEWAEMKFHYMGFSEVKVKKLGGNFTVMADLFGNTVPTRFLSGLVKTILFYPASMLDWMLDKAGRRTMYHSLWVEAVK